MRFPSRGMSKNPRRQASEFPLLFRRLRKGHLARTDSVQESAADVEESGPDVDAGAPPAQESLAEIEVAAGDAKEAVWDAKESAPDVLAASASATESPPSCLGGCGVREGLAASDQRVKANPEEGGDIFRAPPFLYVSTTNRDRYPYSSDVVSGR